MVDQNALRVLDIAVLCIAADGEPSMVNGQPQALPIADLRRELQADPVRSPQSNGMSEAFVKTLKRD